MPAVIGLLLLVVLRSACSDEKTDVGGPVTDAENTASMVMEISINRPQNAGRGYRRPYVAAWLADKDGFPVRTLLLWVQTSGPGPRWIPDLRQWYRDDRFRRLADDTNLVDAVSSPTRNVGTYKVAWDGNDDHGKPLPAGKYTLFVEAAREHGTYQLIRKPLDLQAAAFEEDLAGNVEIRSVRISFRGLRSVR
ncbi:MAG: DUF2271 domain-containing protein [Planctomycetaceae bacterium]|nr:DUF2271 domain-containing protein [Planctomycetaceae bacterium]